MKISHLLTATAATAFIGGAAFSQPATPSAPEPAPAPAPAAAPSDTAAPTGTAVSTSVTTTDASGASVTSTLTTNGPVPDTKENRAKYGQPMSNAGKRTPAKGN